MERIQNGNGKAQIEKSAEGNGGIQSKRDITLSKTGCYDPPSPLSPFFDSHFPVSVPSVAN